ncbi:hypothetical protein KC327_g16669 [Hortaea werneckii]|uniref:Uncharacterized protein n=1 Tax=Hortaea werneckii EXF-2000 TaxID=1157616 RepID=A0A1Z5SM11_HORWE|nr:hypothetical protein KC358_g14778 [Hortaea werneckii]OTA20631.1 hypothetical protein BTJ68_15426 [Hortaea werneckii EXF-2000]KAI6805647.1 hypothetical protein KC350_g14481 [Hortaea werneckii]KAI6900835.1 hypothetical protein KC348_g16691 [Hortaea werneckii]KAI6920468.1 hypothetical protein KC341_g16593 [Hortaea werneckii]
MLPYSSSPTTTGPANAITASRRPAYTMKLSTASTTLLTALLFLITSTTAQLLADGTSKFPACAASCPLLVQAAQACGGTQTASQQTWSCFCQSGYLTSLKSSPNGICDGVCGAGTSENQQVMTWYNSNCGSDFGASEHPDTNAGGATTTSAGAAGTSSSTLATIGTSGVAALPTTSASSGQVSGDDGDETSYEGSWWDAHYKWVIMIIVLFIGLLIIGLIAGWLKHRHDRKRDQIRGGFNEGITSRPVHHHHGHGQEKAAMGYAAGNAANNSSLLSMNDSSQVMAAPPATGLEPGSGRNSPARTREAFMPYGYGYTRSESRLGSRTDVDESGATGQRSPLPKEETPTAEMERGEKGAAGGGTRPKGQRRVLVGERSMQGPTSPTGEK